MGFDRIRVLPLLVLVAMLSFAVRLGEVFTDVRQLDLSAVAAETKDAAPQPKKDDMKLAAVGESAKKQAEKEDPIEIKKYDEWADPASGDLSYVDDGTDIAADLKKRRNELDARENALNQREALMKVTEQQIDQKMEELKTLQKKLEKLLGTQSEEEAARMKSLVKVYEGMKPKEAARILDKLDMGIALSVVGQMSERKISPILAAMDPNKARTLTTLLAKQKKLPALPKQKINLP